MGLLDVFYPKDIIGAVEAARHATDQAVLAMQIVGDEYARGYRNGYQSALDTILIAFNLRVSEDNNRPILSIPE